MANSIEKMIADTFMEMAQGLETGSFGKRPKIALTGMGSEHGEVNSMKAAVEAAKDGIDVIYIGTLEAEGVTTVKVADDEEGHKKMEEMLIESINKPDRATVTNTADITVVKTEDKSWRIKSDDAFLNALMGGLYEATKEIENSFNNAE